MIFKEKKNIFFEILNKKIFVSGQKNRNISENIKRRDLKKILYYKQIICLSITLKQYLIIFEIQTKKKTNFQVFQPKKSNFRKKTSISPKIWNLHNKQKYNIINKLITQLLQKKLLKNI